MFHFTIFLCTYVFHYFHFNVVLFELKKFLTSRSLAACIPYLRVQAPSNTLCHTYLLDLVNSWKVLPSLIAIWSLSFHDLWDFQSVCLSRNLSFDLNSTPIYPCGLLFLRDAEGWGLKMGSPGAALRACGRWTVSSPTPDLLEQNGEAGHLCFRITSR